MEASYKKWVLGGSLAIIVGFFLPWTRTVGFTTSSTASGFTLAHWGILLTGSALLLTLFIKDTDVLPILQHCINFVQILVIIFPLWTTIFDYNGIGPYTLPGDGLLIVTLGVGACLYGLYRRMPLKALVENFKDIIDRIFTGSS